MKACVGIRGEDKSRWERRVPVTPDDARKLKEEHGVEVWGQPSAIRVFSEEEFTQAGVVVQEDLSSCPIIFAVKEMPLDFLRSGRPTSFSLTSSRASPTTCPCLRRCWSWDATSLITKR